MKVIVITGGTRGIGRGLAEAFLSLGCKVTITSRRQDVVDESIVQLSNKFGSQNILAQVCDVNNVVDVQALWDTASQKFGKIDIWINNAGQAIY